MSVYIHPTSILVADLRAYGLDTSTGRERPDETIERGTWVQAVNMAGRVTARGRFVGFDDVTSVLWVVWHWHDDHDAENFAMACLAFDEMLGRRRAA